MGHCAYVVLGGVAAMVTFLSPWARVLVFGGLAVALVLGAWLWHRSEVASHDEAIIAARDAEWRDKLAAALREANERVAAIQAAAYEAGVKAEAARADADAKDEAKAAEVVTTIIATSPSAAACVYDAATAAALNSLRQQ